MGQGIFIVGLIGLNEHFVIHNKTFIYNTIFFIKKNKTWRVRNFFQIFFSKKNFLQKHFTTWLKYFDHVTKICRPCDSLSFTKS